MRGHIRKRGAGYQIVVDVGRDPLTGKRKQKSVGGFKTKKEAEKALAELIAKIEQGEYVEYKNSTLKDFLLKWLENKKPLLKPTTYIFYEKIVNNILIPGLGSTELSKLKPIHIQSFISKLYEREDINSTTIKHYYTTLKTALNQAVKWQLIPSNPCEAVEPPKREKKKMQVLTPEQVNLLLDYAHNSQEVMHIPLLLALTCGLRRGEIIALKWSNVNLEKGHIIISESAAIRKNGKNIILDTKTDAGERIVELPSFVIPILKQHRKKQLENKLLFGSEYKDTNLVCSWPNGEELKPDYITHAFKKLLRKLELPDIRFHDLRHTHATLLLLQGVNPKIVSERLGHASIDITLDIYSHVLPTMQKEAAEKLNDLFLKKA
ncbi:site-specific integrase [Fonticella tunisiensis]|uniref:Integrase n=1 Tax=Fonticella tunisiensis TaxID=1096341 RepID=A0A4R7KUI6_9CLOT|nr:site-specific integrase [Fonticella tunisiensis]TDT63384.1 integrase [Fonticella tunisiensis]